MKLKVHTKRLNTFFKQTLLGFEGMSYHSHVRKSTKRWCHLRGVTGRWAVSVKKDDSWSRDKKGKEPRRGPNGLAFGKESIGRP